VIFHSIKQCLIGLILLAMASAVDAQLLLPTPELRVEKDCDTCPEMVTLPSGLYMSRAPIVVEEFKSFVDETGYKNTGWGCKWNFPGFDQGPRHPVTCVTFESAQAYVEWLKEKTQLPYRLPTAEEMTYAVMAFKTTNYWWGQQIGRDRATCLGCGRAFDAVGTTRVDIYDANPFNLLDAVGNVWIWTTDCKTAACDERILMSGGWSSPPSDLRMSKRIHNGVKVPFNTYGIRVVKDFE